jgi:alkaline phosphatase D
VAYLPTLHIKGMNNPVIQIVDETSKEVVYTLRINGTTYRPKVFKMGDYTITVGEKPDRMKTLRGVAALAPDKSARLDISF